MSNINDKETNKLFIKMFGPSTWLNVQQYLEEESFENSSVVTYIFLSKFQEPAGC